MSSNDQTKGTQHMKKEHINYKKRCLIAQAVREKAIDRVNLFAFLWKNYDHKDVSALYDENPDIGELTK